MRNNKTKILREREILEDIEKSQNTVDKKTRIENEQLLIGHGESVNEQLRGGDTAPEDEYDREDESSGIVEAEQRGEERKNDHGQEAIAEYAADAGGVHTLLGHQVEQRVHAQAAESRDAVDVAELDLAHEQQREAVGDAEDERSG